MKIGIIGAGVIGLTTGLELQKEYRNASISIIADKYYKDTVRYDIADNLKFNQFKIAWLETLLLCF